MKTGIIIGIIIILLVVITACFAYDPNDIIITPKPDGTFTLQIEISQLQAKALRYNGVDTAPELKQLVGDMLDKQVDVAIRRYMETLTEQQKEDALE